MSASSRRSVQTPPERDLDSGLPRREELYGENIRVDLIDFIRPEVKFSGIAELQKNILENAETAKKMIAAYLQKGNPHAIIPLVLPQCWGKDMATSIPGCRGKPGRVYHRPASVSMGA